VPGARVREVGGFDERFVIAYNDVDLCLKIRERGYLIVWTPFAELYHFESVTGLQTFVPQREHSNCRSELFEGNGGVNCRGRIPTSAPIFPAPA